MQGQLSPNNVMFIYDQTKNFSGFNEIFLNCMRAIFTRLLDIAVQDSSRDAIKSTSGTMERCLSSLLSYSLPALFANTHLYLFLMPANNGSADDSIRNLQTALFQSMNGEAYSALHINHGFTLLYKSPTKAETLMAIRDIILCAINSMYCLYESLKNMQIIA